MKPDCYLIRFHVNESFLIGVVQASLFFNGNGSGEGSHVSIYIKILPGEYDALLKWPFSHTVSFTLYDQAANPDKVFHLSLNRVKCHRYWLIVHQLGTAELLID